MATENSALVREALYYSGKAGSDYPGPLLERLADRIEALEAENERLTAERDQARHDYATCDDRALEALEAALTLAANRLHRLVLDQPMGSRSRDEVSEWAAEARAALPHP